MATVTQRIKQIKQPYGGYLPPSMFTVTDYNDNTDLCPTENISPSTIGSVVEYLSALVMGIPFKQAFEEPISGCKLASSIIGLNEGTNPGVIFEVAYDDIFSNITGLDDISIISACKACVFGLFTKNMNAGIASLGRGDLDKSPDRFTIHNIRTMVKRTVTFFNKYGPVLKHGFSFDPINSTENKKASFSIGAISSYGGYTFTVNAGYGDFLTRNGMWDIKVLSSQISSQNTLQLLMYWIMGRHSGRFEFKQINKIGFFNPRLNKAYILNTVAISESLISEIENNVICYETSEQTTPNYRSLNNAAMYPNTPNQFPTEPDNSFSNDNTKAWLTSFITISSIIIIGIVVLCLFIASL